jgi:hypothetical protein
MGGAHAVVAHPRHQVPQRGSRHRGQGVPGVPEIVKVQSRHSHGGNVLGPAHALVEISPVQRPATVSGEDQRILTDGDPVRVQLLSLADERDTATPAAVEGLRGFGYSWGEIASRLGTTRRAEQQRWGRLSARPLRSLCAGGVEIRRVALIGRLGDAARTEHE